MALVDTTKTERLEVPHEEGEWISIRALLATEMDEAQEIRMKHYLSIWGDGDSLPKIQPTTDSPAVR